MLIINLHSGVNSRLILAILHQIPRRISLHLTVKTSRILPFMKKKLCTNETNKKTERQQELRVWLQGSHFIYCGACNTAMNTDGGKSVLLNYKSRTNIRKIPGTISMAKCCQIMLHGNLVSHFAKDCFPEIYSRSS